LSKLFEILSIACLICYIFASIYIYIYLNLCACSYLTDLLLWMILLKYMLDVTLSGLYVIAVASWISLHCMSCYVIIAYPWDAIFLYMTINGVRFFLLHLYSYMWYTSLNGWEYFVIELTPSATSSKCITMQVGESSLLSRQHHMTWRKIVLESATLYKTWILYLLKFYWRFVLWFHKNYEMLCALMIKT